MDTDAHSAASDSGESLILPKELVKDVRRLMSQSQDVFADELGVSRPSVQRMEQRGGYRLHAYAIYGRLILFAAMNPLPPSDVWPLLRRLEEVLQ